MKIVTSSEMTDIEERSADCGVSINVLMDNAGQMVASEIESHFGYVANGLGCLDVVFERTKMARGCAYTRRAS